MKRALITGVAGQDGWYLAQRLLQLGYEVVGTTHRSEQPSTLDVAGRAIALRFMDLQDAAAVAEVIRTIQPTEIYNFAARASSAQLFDDPLATADINGVAVARLLEAIRQHCPQARFCQASSSEVFAGAEVSPQDESTLRSPTNAYAAAKAFADHLVAAYRSTHGIFAGSAILFPHESERRPPHFLVRKVAQAAALIKAGRAQSVTVGDLSAERDWGFAPDYVEAMRLMMASDVPDDFVLATGVPHTVQNVCEVAFAAVDLDWRRYVVVDDRFKRAKEPVKRVGSAARAKQRLGWGPSRDFQTMLEALVKADLGLVLASGAR